MGNPGSEKRSLEYQNEVRRLIQQITENRLRHARGSVLSPFHYINVKITLVFLSPVRYKFGFDLEPIDACARVQSNHFINGLEPIRCKTDEKIGLCQFIVPCPALIPQTSTGATLMCRPAFLDAV